MINFPNLLRQYNKRMDIGLYIVAAQQTKNTIIIRPTLMIITLGSNVFHGTTTLLYLVFINIQSSL